MARAALQDELINVARRVEMGLPVNRDKYNVSNGICFYARKVIATVSATTYTFFSSATSFVPPETNWPQSTGLNMDQVFLWEFFGFQLEANNDLANAAVANGELSSVTTMVGATNAEQYKNLMQAGDIRGYIGTRQVLAGHGPITFPAGHALDNQGMVYPTLVAAAQSSVSNISLSNGEANLRNRFPLDPVQYVLGNEVVKIQWDVPSRTLTAAPVVKACMWGTLIRASNR